MSLRVRAALLGCAGTIALTSGVAWADCSDPFADPDDIVSLHLRISSADWWTVRFEDPVGFGCDAQYPFVQADFRCGEAEPWISIGVRRKRGEQRGRDTVGKPPLKLDFNRYVQGQRWPEVRGDLGFRKLTLNNGQADMPDGALTALLTEHYAWRLMREEIPDASGVAYARLTVHFTDDDSEEYHGLYILIEDIDRTAIRARYPTDRGRLVKTTVPECRDQLVFDDGINPATDEANAWLRDDPSAYDAAGWQTRTERAVHLEHLLRQEALRDVLNNIDDSVSGSYYNNYFAYDRPSDKRRYLPWDLDDLFRPFPQSMQYAADEPLSETCSPVGERTRCLPELRQRYLEIACQLINGTLAEEKLLAEFAHLDTILRPIIAEEIDLVWTDSIVGKDPLDETTPGTYASEYERYASWIPARIASVREQIVAAGVDCPEGCVSGESEACLYVDCPSERRCIDGRWTGCLAPEEIPDNGVDDDCDGVIDVPVSAGGAGGAGGQPGAGGAGALVSAAGAGPDATGGVVGADGSAAAAGSGISAAPTSGDEGGCGCTVPARPAPRPSPLLAIALAWLVRRRRRF